LYRKSAIVALTFVALLVGLPAVWSLYEPVCFQVPISDRRLGYIYFADGLVRIYQYQADEAFYIRSVDDFRGIAFYRRVDDAPLLRVRHGHPWQVRKNELVVMHYNQGRRTGFAFSLYGLRLRVSLVIAICMAYPVIAVLVESFRRYRRAAAGYCLICDYDLTGNTSGYCTECGAGILRSGRCRGCGTGPIVRSRMKCPSCGLPIASRV